MLPMSAAGTVAPIPSEDRLHVLFVTLVLPRLQVHGRVYFRHLRRADRREEAVAEMVGLAWRWFVQLAQRGKDATRFVSTLAGYAARAVNSGRRVCGQERLKDVLSPLAQRRHCFRVEPLPAAAVTPYQSRYGSPRGQQHQDAFEERLQDNTITPVPDQVQFRIDFPTWLATLTGRERRLIRAMAQGERTSDLSHQFQVSPARISQLRREFRQGWSRFCGDSPAGPHPVDLA
jgi:hypothetical protein